MFIKEIICFCFKYIRFIKKKLNIERIKSNCRNIMVHFMYLQTILLKNTFEKLPAELK